MGTVLKWEKQKKPVYPKKAYVTEGYRLLSLLVKIDGVQDR